MEEGQQQQEKSDVQQVDSIRHVGMFTQKEKGVYIAHLRHVDVKKRGSDFGSDHRSNSCDNTTTFDRALSDSNKREIDQTRNLASKKHFENRVY